MKKPPLIKKLTTRFHEKLAARKMREQGIVFKNYPLTQETLTPPQHKDNTNSITVILNAYKRPGYMPQQVAALRCQTVPPAQIWVWCNNSGEATADFSDIADRVVVSNFNWKFFGRFALANLASTAYVALFDDDIMPQPLWFENCLRTIHNGHDGILGGSGVLLPTSGGYSAKEKVGWNGEHLNTATKVDLVGHAWFARKAHYRHLWHEEPYSWDNGEDIHLSYMALKHGGIHTYVPPHPPDDMRQWSCDPEFGKIAGGGKAATYKRGDHIPIRDGAVRHYQNDGWKIVNDG